MTILTAEVLAHIEKLVAAAPPLTPRQVTVITAALQPGLSQVAGKLPNGLVRKVHPA